MVAISRLQRRLANIEASLPRPNQGKHVGVRYQIGRKGEFRGTIPDDFQPEIDTLIYRVIMSPSGEKTKPDLTWRAEPFDLEPF